MHYTPDGPHPYHDITNNMSEFQIKDALARNQQIKTQNAQYWAEQTIEHQQLLDQQVGNNPTQASIPTGFNLMILESLVVAILAGILSSNFIIGIVALAVTFFLFYMPVIGTILVYICCAFYGVASGFIIYRLSDSEIASVITGAVILLITVGIHKRARGF